MFVLGDPVLHVLPVKDRGRRRCSSDEVIREVIKVTARAWEIRGATQSQVQKGLMLLPPSLE